MSVRQQVATEENSSLRQTFREFSPAVCQALESITFTTTYPTGAVLFVEGQTPRGVFFLSKGRVKLSVCARDGKTLILRIAEPGEVLGVGAALPNGPYEATAETLEPCEISFVRQSDLQRLMRTYNDFAMRMAEHLSFEYNSTCREIRNLLLSDSASEKLARLLVDWMDKHSEPRHPGQLKLSLTHEEIAQMIGTSRETVTRLFALFKKKQLIQQNGATLVVRDRTALQALIAV